MPTKTPLESISCDSAPAATRNFSQKLVKSTERTSTITWHYVIRSTRVALIDQDWLIHHTAAYREHPQRAHDWDSSPVGGTGIVPTLLLTTVGARSGLPRSVPLLYQPCGEGYVVAGSRGGSRRHPAWFLNLRATPACTALVGRLSCTLSARELAGDERARYWQLLTRCWPAYETYQARTTRQIPVVLLAHCASPTLIDRT